MGLFGLPELAEFVLEVGDCGFVFGPTLAGVVDESGCHRSRNLGVADFVVVGGVHLAVPLAVVVEVGLARSEGVWASPRRRANYWELGDTVSLAAASEGNEASKGHDEARNAGADHWAGYWGWDEEEGFCAVRSSGDAGEEHDL